MGRERGGCVVAMGREGMWGCYGEGGRGRIEESEAGGNT